MAYRVHVDLEWKRKGKKVIKRVSVKKEQVEDIVIWASFLDKVKKKDCPEAGTLCIYRVRSGVVLLNIIVTKLQYNKLIREFKNADWKVFDPLQK